MMPLQTTTSDEVQESCRDRHFPDFDDAGLAARLRLSVSTIRAWRCRHPERLPPGVRIGRSWLYDKNVVERWLAAERESSPSNSLKTSTSTLLPSFKRRGKPSKNETTSAKAVGLTVPVWRAMQAGVFA